jgi:hypothetical protein
MIGMNRTAAFGTLKDFMGPPQQAYMVLLKGWEEPVP